MGKSNKELAVELYSAYLMAEVTAASKSDVKSIKIPDLKDCAADVGTLAKLLAEISAD